MSDREPIFFNAFKNQIKKSPEKNALIVDERVFSFKQLNQWCLELEKGLANQINLKHKKIIVIAENGILFPIAAMLVSKHLGTLIPVAPTLKPKQIATIFESSKPDFAVITSSVAKNLVPHFSKLIGLDNFGVVESAVAPKIVDLKLRDDLLAQKSNDEETKNTFIMNFTSGSTGEPKPVCVSEHVKHQRIIRGTLELFGLGSDDVTLVSTPQYHSLGLRQSMFSMVTGGTGVILSHFSPRAWLNAVGRYKVTFSISVPSQLQKILDFIDKDNISNLITLKTLVSSSAPFSPKHRFICKSRLDCKVFECYGASEVGIATTLEITGSHENENSVGVPADYASIQIFDHENSNSVTDERKVGQIGIKSALSFSHYYRKKELTENALVDGYFLTGDLGYLNDSGELILSGRISEVIKQAGISVYPTDIETCCNEIEKVDDSCAVGFLDESGCEKIGLAVVSKVNVSSDQILRHLIARLAPWQIPRTILQLNEFPKTPIGKLDRVAVQQAFQTAEVGVQ